MGDVVIPPELYPATAYTVAALILLALAAVYLRRVRDDLRDERNRP